MALRSTIDLDAPDVTDRTVDVTAVPRGVLIDGTTYTPWGHIVTKATHTVKRWIANTKAACDTAETSYVAAEGTGSLRISIANDVTKAYTLEITETENTVEFVPVPEE
jgi:hypothetical protein